MEREGIGEGGFGVSDMDVVGLNRGIRFSVMYGMVWRLLGGTTFAFVSHSTMVWVIQMRQSAAGPWIVGEDDGLN